MGKNFQLHNNVVCYKLRPFAQPVACCCVLLRVVAQSLKAVKLLVTYKLTKSKVTFSYVRARVRPAWFIKRLSCRLQRCWPTMLRPFARGLIWPFIRLVFVLGPVYMEVGDPDR